MSDEEIEYLGSKPASAPAHVDPASWHLIQQLHGAENVATVSEASNLERDNLAHDTLSGQQLLDEQANLAYALQLHQQQLHQASHGKAKLQSPEQVLDSLNANTERKAYLYAQEKAHKKHREALDPLRTRVTKMGFQESALDNCLNYIRDDAPIIIHLTEATLQKLVNDTHYRSRFETNNSGGNKCVTTRQEGERHLFGGSYDGCLPFLRPKYGCLNISGDIAGVQPAKHYGTFFLTLDNSVRYRSTFSDKDTGSDPKTITLATNKYYAHILNQYPDADLQAALSVSRIGGAPSKCRLYKEVQIHGAITLDSDIQSLSVPGKETDASSSLKKMVQDFQKQTNCNILWQGDLLGLWLPH